MSIRNEFQVVVLAAGKGSRMPELTSAKPKCLLPIGGRPLLWYTLEKLRQTGFTEVILIVGDRDKSDIQATLEKTDLCLKIDYVCIPSAEEWGTAESLRFAAEKIKLDVLIVSSDLITNMNLIELLHEFRKHNAALCSLYFPTSGQNIAVPGPKSNYTLERDLIGIENRTNRLIFIASSSDCESEIAMPLNMFRKHPNIQMYNSLLDAHFYVMKHWMLTYLSDSNKFTTFKAEFLPYALKQQFKTKPATVILPPSNVSEVKPLTSEDIFDYCMKSELQQQNGDIIQCYALIAPKDVIGMRVNNLQAYWAVNQKIATICKELFTNETTVPEMDAKSKATVKSSQIDACFIWDGVSLSEKTSFRNCVIGSNSHVKNMSRISNSILMNNVQIEERVIIENCIICDDVIIQSNCKLKNCIVSAKVTIPAQSEHASEVLTNTDIF